MMEIHLPGIREELRRLSPESGVSQGFDYLSSEWPAFAEGLVNHFREEETFLFPRLLDYDYCLRHRGSHPDFTSGSVNVFVAIHLIGNERRQMDAFHRFIEGWYTAPAHPASPYDTATLSRLLTTFNRTLTAHNKLESEVLFPLAVALEKASYDAAIAGPLPR